MDINFENKITWRYGWKHFFGAQDKLLADSDNTLFICIVRDPVNWLNSCYRNMHHFPLQHKHLPEIEQIDTFLNKEFWSAHDDTGEEILEDRNIYTGNCHKNIFELRHTKIRWMVEDLPKKVKNSIFITYEELVNDFENTLVKIKNKGLTIKDANNFPINSTDYKNNKLKFFIPKEHIKELNKFSKEDILSNPNFIPFYENKLYYNDTI